MESNVFVPVTKHYGYVLQYLDLMNEYAYVVYRSDKPKTHSRIVTARRDREEAIKECEYLEKLNAPIFIKNGGES